MRKSLIATALALVSTATPFAQSKRAVTFDDVLNVKTVAAASISPDAAQIIYTVRQWVSERDRMESRTHIWKVVTNGSSPARQITFGDKGESQPQWSPDGRFISFVSSRGAGDEVKSQIYLMPSDGGEAWKLTDSKENISSHSWAPDASRIAFVALDPRSTEEEANIKKRDDERVFEGDFRFAHVWVVDVATKASTRISEGTAYTVSGAPSWAPDGKRFVFGAGTTPMLRDNRRDVFMADLTTRQIEKLSTNFGNDGTPRWSPDGKLIAWTTEPDSHGPIADGTAVGAVLQSRLMLYDVAAKTVKEVPSRGFDTDIGTPQWTAEGKRITFVSGKRAYTEVFAYDLTTGAYSQLSSKRTINGSSYSRDGKVIAVTMDTPDSASEVFVTDPAFATFRRLTTTNPQLAELAQGDTEVVTWKSSDGMEVEGVLLKPVGFAAGRKYPTLVVAHGGPSGAHVNGFRVGGLEGRPVQGYSCG